jgi:hypothetical protein
MKCPPMSISLKFRSDEDGQDRGFGSWTPLFILVPIVQIILLVLFLIALPFLIISVIVTWQIGWWRWLLFGIPAFFRVMHALPGSRLDFEDRQKRTYISID